jgi:hypothetical protein
LEQRWVAKDAEQVHNAAVRVDQDFNVGCVFRKEYSGAPGRPYSVIPGVHSDNGDDRPGRRGS